MKLTFGRNELYRWCGTPGAWFTSQEYPSLVKGDVRFIEGQLFYVCAVDPVNIWGSSRIAWVPTGEGNSEAMREFKRRITLT